MTVIDPSGQRLPTAADEARFWDLVEDAWARIGPEGRRARQAVAERDPEAGEVDLGIIDELLQVFLDNLTLATQNFSAEELTDLDRVVERRLYEIDRADIQAVTDGSDDGFLYARGFIVALGRDYYAAVARNPRLAVLDAECEEMCYFFATLYHERYDRFPDTGSGISRESTNNPAGWPN
ncbi:MAG TPA: DUF4240 domain-containing protein [Pseudonocardiaceae bacterium]|nr:DUF4240 domain-containing protein [Pseudonocardiaceae bacterium]